MESLKELGAALKGSQDTARRSSLTALGVASQIALDSRL